MLHLSFIRDENPKIHAFPRYDSTRKPIGNYSFKGMEGEHEIWHVPLFLQKRSDRQKTANSLLAVWGEEHILRFGASASTREILASLWRVLLKVQPENQKSHAFLRSGLHLKIRRRATSATGHLYLLLEGNLSVNSQSFAPNLQRFEPLFSVIDSF